MDKHRWSKSQEGEKDVIIDKLEINQLEIKSRNQGFIIIINTDHIWSDIGKMDEFCFLESFLFTFLFTCVYT